MTETKFRTVAPFGWAAQGSTLFVWDNPEKTRWHAVYDLNQRSNPYRNLMQEGADALHIADLLNGIDRSQLAPNLEVYDNRGQRISDLESALSKVLAIGCIRRFWGASQNCEEYKDGRELCAVCNARMVLLRRKGEQ